VAPLGGVDIAGNIAMGVRVSGLREMGVGSPASPPLLLSGAYASGDRYTHVTGNTNFATMFDFVRNKWLSSESIMVYFGRNGATASTQFYRGVDGLLMSATSGIIMPHNGTIVAMGYTRSDTDSAGFEVVASGVSKFTNTSTATSDVIIDINVDVSASDIIAIRNAGANDTSDVSGWVKIKLRG